MKKTLRLRTVAAAVLAMIAAAAASGNPGSSDEIWTKIERSELPSRPFNAGDLPSAFETFRLDRTALRNLLRRAPIEFTDGPEVVLTMPMPDGSLSRFRVERSPLVEPGLLAKYPELGETYRGYGIDDPTASVRFDLMPGGFHSMILSSRGTIVVDPYVRGDAGDHISYYKKDRPGDGGFHCAVDGGFESLLTPKPFVAEEYIPDAPAVINGSQLRTYRLALASTWEYCNTVGGNTVAGCLAGQVTAMNRVNGVYERELAIRMVIIANNNLIAFAGDNMTCGPGLNQSCTSANDPYTNSSGSTMMGENQTKLDAVIGSANYDIGHVFSTGGGGIATLNGPCTTLKARGVTGLPNPTGDTFYIDYVAHEMGHQFGAFHSFNGSNGSCGGGRSASAAYEPGSGITIMGYAGICGTQNLAGNSIDVFHVKSLEEIIAFKEGVGSCGAASATGNTPPNIAVVGGPSFNIPRGTPFRLTANGSDVNGDTVTYGWEEYDLGPAAPPDSDADGSARPIFRSYLPTTSASRTFPSLQFVLNNANVPPSTTNGFLTGEILPSISRTMTFQVTARDNRANGGGINTATATVVVSGSPIGPFAVTAPNTNVTWTGGSSQTVTWNVAGTSGSPINTANVNILYSTDGGNTFPTTLASNTPNDGSQIVTIPVGNTTTARIKVEAVGNIYFDVSDVNFTVSGVAAPPRSRGDNDGDGKTDLWIFRPSDGNHWIGHSGGTTAVALWGISEDIPVPGDYDNDSKTDIAVWRPSNGIFYIINSSNLTFTGLQWGISTDIPVVGDYNGDGRSDAAVWRSSTTTWYVLYGGGGGFDIRTFGAAGELPLAGDFDGDGRTDHSSFNPTTANWRIRFSGSGSTIQFPFGASGDIPVTADYNGDNVDDYAVFRPTNGTWHLIESGSGPRSFSWGQVGDIPVPGDYDGDGRDDPAIYRNGQWYLLQSMSGFALFQWGLASDKPIPRYYMP